MTLDDDDDGDEHAAPDIATATGQELIDAFEALGVTKPCHRCGFNDFTVLPERLTFTMLTPLPWQGGGACNLERRVLVSVVVCRVCRAVTFHGCGPGWGSVAVPPPPKPEDAKTKS